MTLENTLFLCECGDVHHQFIVSFFDDDDPQYNDTIYFQVHLSDLGFWRRLKYAFLYLLGNKSKCSHGAFSEVLLNKEETAKLIEVLQKHYDRMV